MDDISYYNKISSTSSALYDVAIGHESSNERYTEMEEIGEGVVKRIKRVLDLTSGRIVAMATPQPDLSKEQLQRFHEEARLTASLEHSNIMQVYDLGFNQEGTPYFTMKLCSSKKLTDFLDNSASHLFELMDIYLRVCEALSYAHSAGAVHRDLKPENILLGNFGEVLVCDWGSAQIIPGSIMENEVGLLSKPLTKGTPGFMAPEQFELLTPSPSQDIYALGAILYQILCGKVSNPENFRKPSKIISEIPVGLEAVCLKAMAQNPEERYRNVEEIIQEIKAWMSGFATQAEGASFHKQLKLMIKRHKALSSSILASLLIIAFLSFIYINNLQDKEKQTRIQRDRAEKALKLYDLEKESRNKIATHGAGHFIDGARRLIRIHLLDDAEDLLEALPESAIKPEHQKRIYALKGRIAFFRQQFNLALDLFSRGVGEDKEFITKVARHFIKIKPEDSKLLDTKGMVDIIQMVNQYHAQLAYGLYRFQILHYKDIMNQVHIIEQMIYVNNEGLDKINISLTKEDGKLALDLSNNPGMTNAVPVRMIDLNKLNFANSPVSIKHFNVLYPMPLEEINLSGCGIRDYRFLKEMKSLKTIIVNQKESNLPSFKKHSSHLTVIVKSFPGK